MSHISRFVKQSRSRQGRPSSSCSCRRPSTDSEHARGDVALYLFSNDRARNHRTRLRLRRRGGVGVQNILPQHRLLKLNPRTIQFFFFTGADNGTLCWRRQPQHPDAPPRPLAADDDDDSNASLHERATRFLTIPRAWFARRRHGGLELRDPGARAAGYCPLAAVGAGALVAHAGATTAALTDATLGATNDGPGASERSNLVAELVDLLHYVDDLASVPDPSERTGGEDFATRAEEELWSGLVEPTLMRSIAATNASDSSETDASVSPRTDAIVSGASPSRDAGPPIVSPATALFALSRLFASSTRRSILARASAALLRPTDAMGRPNPRRLAVVRALRGDRENLAAAAATAALTALVTSRHADVDELRAAGLRAAAEGDEAEMDDAREEMADALVDVVTRREPGAPAETRACAAFLCDASTGPGPGPATTTTTASEIGTTERPSRNRSVVEGSRRWTRRRRATQLPSSTRWTGRGSTRGPLSPEWTRARGARSDRRRGRTPRWRDPRSGGVRGGKRAMGKKRRERGGGGSTDSRRARVRAHGDAPRRARGGPTGHHDAHGVSGCVPGDAAATAAATGYPPPSAFARTETWKCARGRRFSCLARRSEVQTGTPRACRVAWRSKPVANVASFSSSRRASRARASPPPRYSSSPSRTHRREGTSGWFERWRRSRGAGRRLTRRIESGYTRACDRRNRASLVADGNPTDAATARRRLRRGHWTLAFADEAACASAKAMVDARAATLRNACRVAAAPIAEAAGKREAAVETERRGKNERRGNNERRRAGVESRRRAGVESRR